MAIQNLSAQFGEAQANVNLGRRRLVAQAAHLEVRAVLNLCPDLRKRGLDDVLIGSYARDTGIWPGKDVDIFGKLTAETIESILPEAAYQLFLDALSRRYEGRMTEQPRSIKIDFGPGDERAPAEKYLKIEKAASADLFAFSVDVVPAVRSNEIWAIPARDRNAWARSSAKDRWIRTDPETLTELTSARNHDVLVSGQGAFVPTVKAVRQIRREHLGDAKPGGLFLELVLHEGFASGEIAGDSWADVTANALAFCARRLRAAHADPVCDPVLVQPYSPSPDATQLAVAADIFERLASEAHLALTQDQCPAAAAWRHVFGSNAKGPVFPLPAGCRCGRHHHGSGSSGEPSPWKRRSTRVRWCLNSRSKHSTQRNCRTSSMNFAHAVSNL